ncbi:hypothetical protein [Bradyrhizobium sp. 1(2017)]|uniref:hypothetical protein n=1 Tax=Bradyrhizobium sp. 1(2017) TaxID=1404888 RepID=UPI00140F0193|nr:hypothetical protein [Bradyrhizobium sp. 1(2017)]QIO30765.1 hypothetical protein HAP40_02475 [Bradyrhizobium sp. 1(2017)]
MRKLALIGAFVAVPSFASAQKGADVAAAATLHQEYTDVVIASDECPGITLDINKWDKEVRKVAGSSGPGMLKAFEVSEQGGAWRDKRQGDFKANPTKECADVLEAYGPKGLGLLRRK